MKPEWICGLPFYTPSNKKVSNVTIGEVVEELIQIKNNYNIKYPHSKTIDIACDILDGLQTNKSLHEWIKENTK